MNLKCTLGLHEWTKDCEKCSKCDKTRQNRHDWSKDCQSCSICGKTRTTPHNFTAWTMKSVNLYYCGHHRCYTVGRKSCSVCGKEEFCRDHDIRLIDTKGTIYDSTEYYRCLKCGYDYTVSNSI